MKKHFFVGLLAISLPQLAFAHDHQETPISDLLEGAEVAASLYSGPPEAALAIEASRYPGGTQPQGVSVRLLTRGEGDAVASQTFECPYSENREVANCNAMGAKEGEGPFALQLAAVEALNEAAPEAGLPLDAIVFVKAWPSPARPGFAFVRAGYQSQTLGSGNAVFSCHAGGHGGDDLHMHCHFLNQNPTGPNEPQAGR